MGGRGATSSSGGAGGSKQTGKTSGKGLKTPAGVDITVNSNGTYHSDELGFNVSASIVKEIGEETTYEIFDSVAATYRLFGVDGNEGAYDTILKSGERFYAAANVTRGGNILINKDYFGNKEHMAKRYAADVANGYHPKGSTYKQIISHEAAHTLQSMIGDKLIAQMQNAGQSLSYDKMFGISYGDKGMDMIFSQAAKNVKKAGTMKTSDGKKMTNGQMKKSISRYAEKNGSETWAEAVADVVANGSNANAISQEMVRLAKGVINGQELGTI